MKAKMIVWSKAFAERLRSLNRFVFLLVLCSFIPNLFFHIYFLQISLDMGNEIREHNRYLSGMDQDFESVYGSLKNSMSRLTKIALSGGNRLYFYLIVFSFFVFFVIYMIMKLR